MGIGKAIGKECERRGMSLRELSIKADVPYSTLYSAVKRDSDGVSAATLNKLEKALAIGDTGLCKEVCPNTIYKPKLGSDLALLPCPFCGNEDIVYMSYSARDGSSGERWEVLCCYCAAGVNPGWAQQKSDVRDLWNRRAVNR